MYIYLYVYVSICVCIYIYIFMLFLITGEAPQETWLTTTNMPPTNNKHAPTCAKEKRQGCR